MGDRQRHAGAAPQAILLLGCVLLGGCAGGGANQACLAKPDHGRVAGSSDPGLMVSGSTPPGVYGVSNPGAYYSSVNSFPPGAAGVDGRCIATGGLAVAE